MPDLSIYQSEFNAYLEKIILVKEPINLYEPIDYIMKLGGKRLRPALTLLAADLLGGESKKALPAILL